MSGNNNKIRNTILPLGALLFGIGIPVVEKLFYRPIGCCNKITVAGNSGTMISINFRHTVPEVRP